MKRKSKIPPESSQVFAVGDRVVHKKSLSAPGEVIKLANGKAFVQWKLSDCAVAYRMNNLVIASPSSHDLVYEGRPKPSWKQGEKFKMRLVYKADHSDACEITGVLLEDCEYPGWAKAEYYDPKLKKLITETVFTQNLAPLLFPKLMPEVGDEPKKQAAPNQDSIKLGDRVTFKQYWYGELHPFEGTVQKINAISAIVNYQVPQLLADGVERLNLIESVIATFALAKVAEVLPPEYSESDQLLAQIAAIRAEGAIAPDHCWIEQWKRAENFVEVRYKARSTIFPGKRGGMAASQYIGKRGSPAHSAAVEAVDRRNRIVKLEKQLKPLEALNDQSSN